MRRIYLSSLAACLLLAPGCDAVREGLFDCVFDTFWDAGETAVFGPDKPSEDDKYIAKRKGMSQDQYKQLKAEEDILAEMRED